LDEHQVATVLDRQQNTKAPSSYQTTYYETSIFKMLIVKYEAPVIRRSVITIPSTDKALFSAGALC